MGITLAFNVLLPIQLFTNALQGTIIAARTDESPLGDRYKATLKQFGPFPDSQSRSKNR